MNNIGDLILHISPAKGEVVVEREIEGVMARKTINPDDLANCFLASRYDDERHPTGLLPEGCIGVTIMPKYTYYYIRYDGQIEQFNRQIEEKKRKISDVALYLSKRAELTFANLRLNKVAISLYDVVKTTGEVKDTFKFTYDGRSYDRLSLSEKIRAGMEVAELMKRLTGRNYPVFVDNMESVDDLANVRPTGQVIMARCVHGAALSVQNASRSRPVQQMPQAA